MDKKRLPYAEPSMETVLLKGSDIIVTSNVADSDGEKWDENIPSNGWT